VQPDILILGAGVIGSSIAFHLAQRGLSVMVIDRGPTLGTGSTSKATGGFRAQFDNETEVRLSLLSRRKLQSFADETGVDSGYTPHGYLFLACSPDELDMMRAAQAVQHACGLQEARMVSAAEALDLNPAVDDPTVIGGCFCPTDGFLRPMNVLRGYAESAERLGATFQFDTEFLGFVRENGRIASARTSRGELAAGAFVNALGAWSGPPVTPLRRNVAATVPTSALPDSMPMTIWAGDWYHLRVRDGRVLLLWPDEPCVEDWLAQIRTKTAARVPRVAGLPIEECWSGLYEMTPDGRAIVGRTEDNLFAATGCSGHGVMHSPAIGQLVAELILEGRTSIDITALRPDRFS
jgi:sarcosine oxidase subunit beta